MDTYEKIYERPSKLIMSEPNNRPLKHEIPLQQSHPEYSFESEDAKYCFNSKKEVTESYQDYLTELKENNLIFDYKPRVDLNASPK